MKSVSSLLRIFFYSVFVLFMSCKGGSDPEPTLTEKEKVTQLLTAGNGKWNPAPLSNWIMVEGVNVTDLFKDFSITFTSSGFTTTGTTPVWPRTGSWAFKDDTAKILIRESDKKEITIESLDEKNLRITLTWDQETYANGRMQSVAGKHEFNLTK